MEKLLSTSNSTKEYLKRLENRDRSCWPFRTSKYTKCLFAFFASDAFGLFIFSKAYVLVVYKVMSLKSAQTWRTYPPRHFFMVTHWYSVGHVHNNACEHTCSHTFLCTGAKFCLKAESLGQLKGQRNANWALHYVRTKICQMSCFVSTDFLSFSSKAPQIYIITIYIYFWIMHLTQRHTICTNLFALRE